ncbi:DUF4352 domain-containing protein [Halobacterium jilantaiense]|uniref:Uncharacterized protein n=1 Tax=Halobacterium jilantaiense TaxID=355548 RepID=A0A1I0P0W1_9EURY|nr:DUF4352 domain-containing protein [Halobacterium jilantaiense]SEW07108.1 protein of unknown function [Halobacterium jilantaiense]
MNRRELLKLSAVSIPAATAGCSMLSSGDGDGEDGADGTETPDVTTTDGPAAFGNVAVAVPEDPVVGAEFSPSVTVANVGGESGPFTGTLAVSGANQETNVDVETDAVDPGETITVDVGPLTLDAAGEYEFALPNHDAAATARVGPATAPVGEPVSFGDDLRVTVEDITLTESVFGQTTYSGTFSSEPRLTAFGAATGDVLAIVRVSAENTGTSTTSASPGTFQLADGEWYADTQGLPDSLVGEDGSWFADGGLPEIAPSDRVTGYLFGTVPRDAARSTVTVQAQLTGSGTLPERAWELEPADGSERSLPNVSVESVDTPDQPLVGRRYDVEVTLRNEGDADGTFRDVVQWGDEWTQATSADGDADLDADVPIGGSIETTVPAGKTTTTLTSYSVYTQQFSYRLAGAGTEWTVEFTPAELEFGEAVLAEGNTDIEVRGLRLQDELTVYDDFQDEESQVSPGDGNQYAAVEVHLTRRDEDADASEFDYSGFDLVADGAHVGESTYVGDEVLEDWYEATGDITASSSVSGWYLMEAPAEYTMSDLVVEFEQKTGLYDRYEPLIATWE